MTADGMAPPPVMTAHFVVPNDVTGTRGEGLVSETRLASCLDSGRKWVFGDHIDLCQHSTKKLCCLKRKRVLVAICQSVMVYL